MIWTTSLLGLLFAAVPCLGTEAGKAVREAARAALLKLGGEVEVATGEPGQPLARVDLSFQKVTHADLLPLKNLSELRALDLAGTQITETGLEHLQGLI